MRSRDQKLCKPFCLSVRPSDHPSKQLLTNTFLYLLISLKRATMPNYKCFKSVESTRASGLGFVQEAGGLMVGPRKNGQGGAMGAMGLEDEERK